MIPLLTPDEQTEFMSAYWPDQAMYTGPNDRRCIPFMDVFDGASVASLLARYDQEVSIRRPDGASGRVSDPAAAERAYEDGCTLYFRRVNEVVTGLQPILDGFVEQLGLPKERATMEVFASNGTSGVGMHSDYDINFQFLLSGRKTWRIAPNSNVQNQTEMCLPDGARVFDPFQMEIADKLPFPKSLDKDGKEVIAEAGSMIFIPCGWWHETRSEGEAFACNIVCKGPRFGDVVTLGLRRHLFRDPRWRAYAIGLFGDKNATAPAGHPEYEALLAETIQALGKLPLAELADILRSEYLAETGVTS